MATEFFTSKNFTDDKLARIEQANEIIQNYSNQGYTLTLRQLYYQFVARDLIANTMQSYKTLGTVVNDGRLAGMIDWDAIEDRTRNLQENPHWTGGDSILRSAAHSFALDKWANQDYYIEVWIEKEALIGVIESICSELDVPYFACKGYNSQSEQWRAGKRLQHAYNRGKQPIVLHLGDHDPSGIDMTRDNEERLSMFARCEVCVNRLALNLDQIQEYGPPPNPAKLSDSRASGYVSRYGYDSWELDALEPAVLEELIGESVLKYRDVDAWQEMIDEENEIKRRLFDIAEEF